MSVTLGPWGVPSDVICKRCTRGTWHGLCLRACRVVTWFARMLHGYMVCARALVAWLHGLPIALALALALLRVAGSVSFNAVVFLVIKWYILLAVYGVISTVYSRSVDPRKLRVGIKYYIVLYVQYAILHLW